MTVSILPKIAIINDMAGFGRCSMAVALPVISACKVQACPVPTSIFSNHTGFDTHYEKDLTDCLPSYLKQWENLSLKFDGYLCGFLGSILQMDIISDYFARSKSEETQSGGYKAFYIIDPVMGDHGKPYRTITEEFCQQMKQFIKTATILTPNLTEACLLTDTEYKDFPWTEEDLLLLAKKLTQMGPEKIVITGIKDDTHFHNFIYENTNSYSLYSTLISGDSRPGTGDLFASILSALSVRGFSFAKSVQIAADFIAMVIKATSDAGIPVKEGVIFENFLESLTQL